MIADRSHLIVSGDLQNTVMSSNKYEYYTKQDITCEHTIQVLLISFESKGQVTGNDNVFTS